MGCLEAVAYQTGTSGDNQFTSHAPQRLCAEGIATVPLLKRKVCEELALPTPERYAAWLADNRAFNDNVCVDDLETVLSDGTKVMCKALIEKRTALGVMPPPLHSQSTVGAQ